MSDISWTPLTDDNSKALNIVDVVLSKGTIIDDFTATLDMSSLLDGPYQIRAVAQCTIPDGVTDTSLFKTTVWN